MKIAGVGLTFDDLLLIPRKTSISSRFNGKIDLSSQLLPEVKLKYPIISANMDSVTEIDMMIAMNKLGGLGIVHRFMTIEEHVGELDRSISPKILCIGSGAGGHSRLRSVPRELFDGVLVDVAHGHSNDVMAQIVGIKKFDEGIPIIAGNVATPEGAMDLANAGADCIKIGVGPGSLCSTRVNTGNGVPQATAIDTIVERLKEYQAREKRKITVIADGGICSSGDVVKALALGADAVMIGSLFAGTEEAPGKTKKSMGGGLVKRYRGMASISAQEDWKGSYTSIEGEEREVPYRGPVEIIFNDLISGILSGMSYQDARNLDALRENAEFIRVTPAGLRESLPHGIL